VLAVPAVTAVPVVPVAAGRCGAAKTRASPASGVCLALRTSQRRRAPPAAGPAAAFEFCLSSLTLEVCAIRKRHSITVQTYPMKNPDTSSHGELRSWNELACLLEDIQRCFANSVQRSQLNQFDQHSRLRQDVRQSHQQAKE
jgi:hypothetical protein